MNHLHQNWIIITGHMLLRKRKNNFTGSAGTLVKKIMSKLWYTGILASLYFPKLDIHTFP